MARNLLQIVQATQGELGLPKSSSVIGNTDDTTTQMLSLIQYEVEELNKTNNWTSLHLEYNLIFTPPVTLTGNITINSPIITGLSSTAGLIAGSFAISANGVPVAARILSVDSLTQITMTMYATATTANATIQFAQDTYPEPSDFDRFENNTWYDRTNRWALLGPDSPQLDQFHRSGIVATGPRRSFRQLGYQSNTYRLWPPPFELVVPSQLVFEYITKNNVFLLGNRANPSDTWQNDTDIPILDDRAIINGLKWRFWAGKGLNYAGYRKDYDDYVSRLIARDGGATTLSLVPILPNMYVNSNNVQDGNFPSNPNV